MMGKRDTFWDSSDDRWYYCRSIIPGGPKMAQFLYALTSSNINRFSQLFYYQNQEKICNNTITKDPTTPQVCRKNLTPCGETTWTKNTWKVQIVCKSLCAENLQKVHYLHGHTSWDAFSTGQLQCRMSIMYCRKSDQKCSLLVQTLDILCSVVSK